MLRSCPLTDVMSMKFIVGCLIFFFSLQANAQQTAVFITQTSTSAPEDINFWWRDGGAITPVLEGLNQGLQERGVSVIPPKPLPNVSRVIRQQVLSDSNAMNLAQVIGATQALVGDLLVDAQEPLGPLLIPQYEFTLSLRKLTWNNGKLVVTPLQVINLNTVGHPNVGTGRILAKSISLGQTQPVTNEVGVSGGVSVLVPRTFGLSAVDAVRTALTDGTRTFETFWISRDVVALRSAKVTTSAELQKLIKDATDKIPGYHLTISETNSDSVTVSLERAETSP